jgi:hypothetical protein
MPWDLDSAESIWTPASEHIALKGKAKAMARQVAAPITDAKEQTSSAKTTVLCLAKRKYKGQVIDRVGEYTRKFDRALPGKHTRLLYNGFKRTEAGILAQLRTGMSRLNGYLYRINAAETDLCTCGQAKLSTSYSDVPTGISTGTFSGNRRTRKWDAYHSF